MAQGPRDEILTEELTTKHTERGGCVSSGSGGGYGSDGESLYMRGSFHGPGSQRRDRYGRSLN